MKDVREEWYDAEQKVAVTLVDVTSALQQLARGHLSGPVAAYYLGEGVVASALLGAEMSEKNETVIVQMKCSGPLGGFNVECSAAGALRGYTEKKILEDFDGVVRQPISQTNELKILGNCQFQITRSIPGRIISQGISTSLNGYLADSLQRNAFMLLDVSISDEVEVLEARGMLIEALPDSKVTNVMSLLPPKLSLAVSSRNLLSKLGLSKVELKRTTPLIFGCRCSPDRAIAMLSAMSEDERKDLPETIDITCHMCGKTFTVRTR